ncbi:MAG: tetratricopeptide repeat protein [Candidatus Micrarchaeia archaeon]
MPAGDDQPVDKAYEEIIARSNEFYEKGDYEKALSWYEDATRLEPQQGLSWYMKGMTLFRMEKYDEALLAFEMAAKLDANRAEPLMGKAYVHMKMFRFSEAVECFKEAFIRDENFETACLIGLCYLLDDNEEQAAEWFRKAFSISRDGTLKFFEEMYLNVVLRDENITSDEKVAVRTAIDKLKKKLQNP